MTGRAFTWTAKRERELIINRRDGFTFKECARMIGGRCGENDARARFKVLSAAAVGHCRTTNTEGECGTAREASTAALSGAALSSLDGSPMHASGAVTTPLPAQELPASPSPAERAAPPVRKPLIPLPRYGEMEKRFNPHLRAIEQGTSTHGDT